MQLFLQIKKEFLVHFSLQLPRRSSLLQVVGVGPTLEPDYTTSQQVHDRLFNVYDRADYHLIVKASQIARDRGP